MEINWFLLVSIIIIDFLFGVIVGVIAHEKGVITL